MRLHWSPEKHAIVTDTGEIVENISNYDISYDRIPVYEFGKAFGEDYIEGRMTVRANFDVEVWEKPVDPKPAIQALLKMEQELVDEEPWPSNGTPVLTTTVDSPPKSQPSSTPWFPIPRAISSFWERLYDAYLTTRTRSL